MCDKLSLNNLKQKNRPQAVFLLLLNILQETICQCSSLPLVVIQYVAYKYMHVLDKIFGSDVKVRILRLFLFNPEAVYDMDDLAEKTRSRPSEVKKEMAILNNTGILKRKAFVKEFTKKKGKKVIVSKCKVKGWSLDQKFPHLVPLQTMLIHTTPLSFEEVARRFGASGKIKLLIVSGIFNQEWDSRVDLLIVADGLRKTHVENTVKNIESEVGRELKYAAFETTDFQYRLGMFDKLVRDILDYPHEKLINKLGLE